MEEKRQMILIIDDTPIHIHLLTNILSPYYTIKAATDGRKGIELANKHKIDLILLDIVMANFSGFEVLAELKKDERTKDIRVIFITAMDSTEDEMRGLSLGAVDYITKPFVDEIVLLRVNLHMQLINHIRTIEKLNHFDGTTNIRNRRSFNNLVSQIWDKTVQAGGGLSLIMIDLDNFKHVNENHGYAFGDFCLSTAAKLIQESVQNGENLVFRWDGEEFAVLLPGTTTEQAMEIAETIRINIEQEKITNEEAQVNITASIGVGTIYPDEQDSEDRLYLAVDKAMRKAKETGANRIEVAGL